MLIFTVMLVVSMMANATMVFMIATAVRHPGTAFLSAVEWKVCNACGHWFPPSAMHHIDSSHEILCDACSVGQYAMDLLFKEVGQERFNELFA